jgi:hypothetical protein
MNKKTIAKKLRGGGQAWRRKDFHKDTRDPFMKALDAHKAEGASFDNGTWRPKRKGQSFIEALEAHKARERDFN